jgi:hypothetical protein
LSDPNEIVRRGYDAIADRYDEWAASFVVEEDWLGARCSSPRSHPKRTAG